MTRHDLSHWPLVVTLAQGPSSLSDMQSFMADWQQWLARAEPFATLRVFADAEALARPPGSAPLVKQHLQEQGQAIRQHVIGMATVVPESEYARVSKMNAEKLFGVPAVTFSDVASALDWLSTQVYAPRGLVLDAGAVRAGLDGLRAQTA